MQTVQLTLSLITYILFIRGDSHPHLHLVPDAHQRLLEGSARIQSSLHTSTDLPGPYCVILPTIVDTFFFRNATTNKRRHIKAKHSNTFSSLVFTAQPPSFPLLSPSGFGQSHNEILHIFNHFCCFLCGSGICPVDDQHTVGCFPFPNYICLLLTHLSDLTWSLAHLFRSTFLAELVRFPCSFSKTAYSHLPSSPLHHCMCDSHYFVSLLLAQGQPSRSGAEVSQAHLP